MSVLVQPRSVPLLSEKAQTQAGQPEQHFLLRAVDWRTYEKFLDAVGDRNVRISYDRGNLELMSPSPIHEIYKKWFGRLMDALVLILKIRIKACGSTTFKREDLDRGLEPDECFYLKKAALVRDFRSIDLTFDPPPDLAIEVDITSSSVNRMGIYAALGVPEFWRFDGNTISVYRLGDHQTYVLSAESPSFPFLPLAEFVPFLDQSILVKDDGDLLEALHDWVRERILPQWKNHDSAKE